MEIPMSRSLAFLTALSAAALLACGTNQATPTDSDAASTPVLSRTGPQHAAGPLGRILSQAMALGLTADQVQRLEAIQTHLKEQNQPLFEKIRAAHPQSARAHTAGGLAEWRRLTPEERQRRFAARREARQAFLAAHPELAEVVQQLRANMKAAHQEVSAVLTAEQKATLRSL
jgi:hypothetical protein